MFVLNYNTNFEVLIKGKILTALKKEKLFLKLNIPENIIWWNHNLLRPCHFFMVLGLSSLAKSRCSVPRVPVYLGRFSNITVMALSLSHIIRRFELVLINLFYTYSLVTFLPVLFFNLTVCHHFCKLIDRKQLKFVFPFRYSYLWFSQHLFFENKNFL